MLVLELLESVVYGFADLVSRLIPSVDDDHDDSVFRIDDEWTPTFMA